MLFSRRASSGRVSPAEHLILGERLGALGTARGLV